MKPEVTMLEAGIVLLIMTAILGMYYFLYIRRRGPFKPLEYPIYTCFLIVLISKLFFCLFLAMQGYDYSTGYTKYRTATLIIDAIELCIFAVIIKKSREQKQE